MNCIRCQNEIPFERLEALPETRLCVKCSQEVGGDFEIKVIEENVGGSVISKPIVHKIPREI